MSNSEDIAKAFLDQWQQQWSQLAIDPAWQQMAGQQWQQFAQQMVNMQMPGAMPSANVGGHDPTRAAAHPPASDLGAQLLAECFMRLARLEARLADLESRVSK